MPEGLGRRREGRFLLHMVCIYYNIHTNANSKKNAASLNTTGKTPLAPPLFSSRPLRAFFLRLLPRREIWKLASLQDQSFYDRLFTPRVTLGYWIFQRLHFDPTLQAVVADALAGGANGLCKDLSQRLLSAATVSYSNARQRLPLAFLAEALTLQARRRIDLNPKARWRGLLVNLLDGSTVRMRPHGDIPKHFPPLRNQSHTPADWSLMRVVVCFCAHTGAALHCA